jgi:hypothetical protein
MRTGIYDPPLEECDGGKGCLPNCECDSMSRYVMTTPPSIDCVKVNSSDTTLSNTTTMRDDSSTIVGGVIGEFSIMMRIETK